VTDDDPAPSGFYIDFGTASSPLESGHTLVTAAEVSGAKGDLDRSSSGQDNLKRDVVYGRDMTYTLTDLPAGTYDITLYIGEPDAGKSTRDDDVYLQGVLVDNNLVSPGGTVQARTYPGIVVDAGGTLSLRVDGSAGTASANALVAGMDVVAVHPAISSTESPRESSLTETSAINVYDSYQLTSGSLASNANDVATKDADSDGVPDYKDLFPDNPNLTKISDYINYIADYIADDNVIFAEDWKEQDHDTQFTADLKTILELVIAAEAAEAADQAAFFYLQAFEMADEKLIPRTDGFQEGGSPETDWIIIKEAQDIIYPDLILLSEYLWLSAR
jgi:hypothetical protein